MSRPLALVLLVAALGAAAPRLAAAQPSSANPHTIVLPRDSDGWIEVRGASTAPPLRVDPDDDPARTAPGSPGYGP